jgi:aminoglycoside phosphotransferase (APT) family kinase protein
MSNKKPDKHLNSEKLTTYLAQHLDGFEHIISIEKFAGGQSNPTYKLMTNNGDYVLRKQPNGTLLKSAHAVDREYKVLSALQNTDVPVAKVFHFCADTSIIGTLFYIMEFCQGNIYWNAALSEINSNAIRSAMYDEMNKTLVALHSIDINACGLSDYGKSGHYFKRQLSRWTAQYQASIIQPIVAMDKLSLWLTNNLPEDDGRIALVHGDFRLDNMMFAPLTEATLNPSKVKIKAVLDWELSTLGHPFADLAYQCMQLRMPQGMGTIDGLQGIDRASLGIPSEEEYVARYCQRLGIEKIDNWCFYLAFSFFRLAAIAQGVAKRASQGNASNKNALKVGAFVEPLANMALQVIAKE